MNLKKLILTAALLMMSGRAFTDTSTSRLGITKPSIGSTGWGTKWNTNADTIDLGVAVQSATNTFSAANVFSAGNTFTGVATFTGTPNIAAGATFTISTITRVAYDGTAVAPSIYFSQNTTGLGFYRRTSNAMGVTANGTQVMDITSTAIEVTAASLVNDGVIKNGDGTVAAPGFTWISDSDTGIRRAASGSQQIVSDGVVVASFTSTGVSIKGTNTNDNPLTGYVGEVVVTNQTGNLNFTTSAQWTDLISSTITAGDWLFHGSMNMGANGATITGMEIGMSSTPGNSSFGMSGGYNEATPAFPTAASNVQATIPAWHFQVATSSIVYLKAKGNYTGGPPRAEGCSIVAQRLR